LTDAPNFGGLSVMDVIVRETSIGGGMIATPCCRRPVGGSHGEDAMIDAARIFASACTVACGALAKTVAPATAIRSLGRPQKRQERQESSE
jgi:hypothetical protein